MTVFRKLNDDEPPRNPVLRVLWKIWKWGEVRDRYLLRQSIDGMWSVDWHPWWDYGHQRIGFYASRDDALMAVKIHKQQQAEKRGEGKYLSEEWH